MFIVLYSSHMILILLNLIKWKFIYENNENEDVLYLFSLIILMFTYMLHVFSRLIFLCDENQKSKMYINTKACCNFIFTMQSTGMRSL